MPAEIPDGAFIVARALFNSSLWTMRKDDKILAVTLIGLANWKERKWWDGKRERTIGRGQLVRGIRKLAKEAGLSYQECRTSIKHLEKVGFLTQESTGPYTIITLPKYHKYQDLTKYSDTEWPPDLTHNPTSDQREPNADLTRAQREPNDKQEGDIRESGDKCEKGNTSEVLQVLAAGLHKSGNGSPIQSRGSIAHLENAKTKIALMQSDTTRARMLDFMGYLENKEAIPYSRIETIVGKLFALRESLNLNDNTPADKLFCYALDEGIKHDALQPSYIGTVIRNAIIKWREGVLKF